MGEPRRQKPPEVVGISEGSGLMMELSPAGMYSKDLDLFKCRSDVCALRVTRGPRGTKWSTHGYK